MVAPSTRLLPSLATGSLLGSGNFFVKLAADDARNRSVDSHAVLDEHLDDGVLVPLELALENFGNVAAAGFTFHLGRHQSSFLYPAKAKPIR